MTRPEDAQAKVNAAETRAKEASQQAGEAFESLKAAGKEKVIEYRGEAEKKAEELKNKAEDLRKQGEGQYFFSPCLPEVWV